MKSALPPFVILSAAYLTAPGIMPLIDSDVNATVPVRSFALMTTDSVEKLDVASTLSVKAENAPAGFVRTFRRWPASTRRSRSPGAR